jgi:hypothetical protein
MSIVTSEWGAKSCVGPGLHEKGYHDPIRDDRSDGFSSLPTSSRSTSSPHMKQGGCKTRPWWKRYFC